MFESAAERELLDQCATVDTFANYCLPFCTDYGYITKDEAKQLLDYYIQHETEIPKRWYRWFNDCVTWNWTNSWRSDRSTTHKQYLADIYDCLRID